MMLHLLVIAQLVLDPPTKIYHMEDEARIGHFTVQVQEVENVKRFPLGGKAKHAFNLIKVKVKNNWDEPIQIDRWWLKDKKGNTYAYLGEGFPLAQPGLEDKAELYFDLPAEDFSDKFHLYFEWTEFDTRGLARTGSAKVILKKRDRPEIRVWRNRKGDVHVRGSLVGYSKNIFSIESADDGTLVRMSHLAMSAEDQKYVKAYKASKGNKRQHYEPRLFELAEKLGISP